jgi:VWFA-related protein
MRPHPLAPSVLPAALVAAAVLTAHPSAAPPQGGVELVSLDFRALLADGQAAADLRAGDLSLRVDGKPREIRSIRFVPSGGEPAPAGPADPMPAPPFGANYHPAGGRAILVVIENESLRPGTDKHATEAASRFVRRLSSLDRVAVLTMPRGGVNLDFTTDHDKAAEALSKISGQGSAIASATDRACRTRDTLNALTGLFEGLAPSEGPKTVVFVSSGLLRPTRDAPADGPPGQCELRSNAYDEVGIAADAARVQFYGILPEDLVVDSARTAMVDPTASRFRSTDEEVAGLESLVGVTHGIFQRLPRGDDAAFARVLRETAGHYVLTFEAHPSERNGQSHRIELRSARQDVGLRVRPRLFIAKPPGRSSLTPQAMLRDGKFYSDLPIRTAAYASANPDGSKLTIVALVEASERSLPLASAAFGLIDSRGKLVAQWTANDRELGGLPVMSAGLAAPGTYRLRAAAIDTSGRRGTAEYDLVAQLTDAAPLKLSAMVLGTSRGGSFAPRMQFESDPTAMGYFEIYGKPAGELTVVLEIASFEDGRALVRVPAAIVVAQGETRRVANGVVPIGGLPAGDYVVRGIVSVDGRPLGRVYRTLRKVGR